MDVVGEVDPDRLAEYLVDQADELLVGSGVGEFGKRSRQAAVVPFVLAALLDVEEVPQGVALLGEVPRDGAHIGQFVSHRHDLGIVAGPCEPVDRRLFAGMPAGRGGEVVHNLVALRGHQIRNPVAELAAQLPDGHGRVFHDIVEHGGGEEFLVGRDGGHDGGRLHRMEDVGESFTAPFCTGVGLHGEVDCPVQQTCVQRSVRHYRLCLMKSRISSTASSSSRLSTLRTRS